VEEQEVACPAFPWRRSTSSIVEWSWPLRSIGEEGALVDEHLGVLAVGARHGLAVAGVDDEPLVALVGDLLFAEFGNHALDLRWSRVHARGLVRVSTTR
jgi:hypothetical protein